jgi:hypothetical protein
MGGEDETSGQAAAAASEAKLLEVVGKISDLLKDLAPHDKNRALRAAATILGVDYGGAF